MKKKKANTSTQLNLKVVALSFGALLVGLGAIASARLTSQQGPRENISADVYGNCGTTPNGSFYCMSITQCGQCQNGAFTPVPNNYCSLGSPCNPGNVTPTRAIITPTPVPTIYFAPTIIPTKAPTITPYKSPTPSNPGTCSSATSGYYKCGGGSLYQCNGTSWNWVKNCPNNCSASGNRFLCG